MLATLVAYFAVEVATQKIIDLSSQPPVKPGMKPVEREWANMSRAWQPKACNPNAATRQFNLPATKRPQPELKRQHWELAWIPTAPFATKDLPLVAACFSRDSLPSYLGAVLI